MTSASADPGTPYLSRLNPPQRAAVEKLDGPLLVLAGAGTGKTRVLTTRLGHILGTRRAFPSQILAVTFTNKAAREMKERVTAMIGPLAEGIWLGTFHSLAARILRRHAELLGLKPNFTILDTDDQIRLIKQLLEAERIDDKKWPARVVLHTIERWKDRGLTPDRVPADAGGEVAAGRAVAIYAQYQERLRVLNACDFGDLLLHNVTLFTTRPDVLDEYHRRFRYILVDEYQDTNVAQYLWLRLLAQGHRNLCCVGDDDQSVYGWRGAEVGNILRFEKDFPDATIVRLEQNYRSTGHILACASALIAHNRSRLGKTLWTAAEPGERVHLRGLWDGEEEARWIGEEIETLQRDGQRLGEIALLVRAGFQTREFEERFIALGLPYRVVGGPRFYERAEIRDALAYARILAQPADDLAFERIANVPRRGIGDKAIQTLHRASRAAQLPLTAAAEQLVETDEIKGPARSGLKRLLEDFRRWRDLLATKHHAEVMETVLDESGYTAMWQADRSADAPGRLENLKELITALEAFETLAAFLEHVSLVMENAEASPGDMVSLMTLHSAKGLEFDVVFLPGWEEGLFPHPRALDEKGEEALEEERRLAHVGLTRARRRAYVSFAANRRIHNMWQSSIPSRFVSELPEEHVDRRSEPGLWGGRGAFNEYDQTYEWRAPSAATLRRGPRLIEAKAEVVAPRPSPSAPYARGERVFHEKFGYGTVVAVEAGKLDVEFGTGRKKVMDGFVKRA
ncbi:MAG: UvrD-helicase domain-containing protein [Alphaproteobacteria bacterium]|nr:UvrD-helicase domain-containing protein [Alphaproteobacteria bacterium]